MKKTKICFTLCSCDKKTALRAQKPFLFLFQVYEGVDIYSEEQKRENTLYATLQYTHIPSLSHTHTHTRETVRETVSHTFKDIIQTKERRRSEKRREIVSFFTKKNMMRTTKVYHPSTKAENSKRTV